MFLDIQIDLIILKTYDHQFTLTTKKSLHIIFNSPPQTLRHNEIMVKNRKISHSPLIFNARRV